MTDVRSEFEAWAASKGYATTRMVSGDYMLLFLDLTFDAWKASKEAATKRVPMTDEEIESVAQTVRPIVETGHPTWEHAVARAIEAHHNIKGEQT